MKLKTFLNNILKQIFKPIIDLDKFRTDYNFYIFDLSKQKEKMAAQPIRLEFKFNDGIGVDDYTAYALVLQ